MKITIELPEELVERAQEAGLSLTDQQAALTEVVKREIGRQIAANELLSLTEKLRALPDDEKPSLTEIDSAVKQARAELSAERKNSNR